MAELEFEIEPQPTDIQDWIVELSKKDGTWDGEVFEAIYSSQLEDVERVVLRCDNTSDKFCSANISYVDGTSYSISWKYGIVHGLEHIDLSQVDGENLDRILPHTNGLLRHGYVSTRIIPIDVMLSGMLDMRDRVGEALDDSQEATTAPGQPSSDSEVDNFMDRILKEIESFKKSDFGKSIAISYMDIDPDDVDIPALCAPVFIIDPARDLLPPPSNG